MAVADMVLSIRFNVEERARLLGLCPSGEKLSTWAKRRILGFDVPVVTFSSGTEVSGDFRLTDVEGNVLASFNFPGALPREDS